MSEPELNPIAHPEVQQASVLGYTAGFLSTLALLGAALALTEFRMMPPIYLLGSISGLALIALLCQTFLSFGLDITRHNIWKSVSLVLTVPLFILTIGLTVWMFQQLAINTMIPGANVMPGMTMQPTMLQ
jgi:cytochrome o ubiquinol oxidase operon protein cyoD